MTHLKEGDKAPNFTGNNEKGEAISLATYAGKKLVLFFYPKDMTPGCTAEACNLSENYEMFKSKGYDVLGVSMDPEARHQKFIDKYELAFSLLADTEKETIEAYGVWGPKKFMGKEYDGIHRTTFIINEEGIIEKIFTKVKTKEHTQQIFAE
jgi:peroxiredoxin Q/BCP